MSSQYKHARTIARTHTTHAHAHEPRTHAYRTHARSTRSAMHTRTQHTQPHAAPRSAMQRHAAPCSASSTTQRHAAAAHAQQHAHLSWTQDRTNTQLHKSTTAQTRQFAALVKGTGAIIQKRNPVKTDLFCWAWNQGQVHEPILVYGSHDSYGVDQEIVFAKGELVCLLRSSAFIFVHLWACPLLSTNPRTCAPARLRASARTHARTPADAHGHARTHARTRMDTHRHAHMHARTRTDTRTDARARARTHGRTHAHTHARTGYRIG